MKQKIKLDLKYRIVKLWRHFRAGVRCIFSWPTKLRQRFHKEKPLKADFIPEMEYILNKIIRDTVGTGGSLDQEFLRYTAQIDEDHPIGETEARDLLLSLLKLAVAKRDLINGRIEHSVEYGSLYYRYYAKLQTIYDLNVETNIRREELAAAQRDYFFAYNMYNNVRDMTFDPKVTRKYSGENYAPPPPAVSTEGGSTR